MEKSQSRNRKKMNELLKEYPNGQHHKLNELIQFWAKQVRDKIGLVWFGFIPYQTL